MWQEPHRGVVMVTGFEEAMAVYNDHATFSSCNTVAGPFAEWPVPLEGDDISEIIEQHRDGCRSATSCRRSIRRSTPRTEGC